MKVPGFIAGCRSPKCLQNYDGFEADFGLLNDLTLTFQNGC